MVNAKSRVLTYSVETAVPTIPKDAGLRVVEVLWIVAVPLPEPIAVECPIL